MATKGFKQPYWIASDCRTVMTWKDGKRAVEWVAPSLLEAERHARAMTVIFQLETYGLIDPALPH